MPFWKPETVVVDKTSPQYISHAIHLKAKAHALDPRLVAAIVWRESLGCVWAFRYEDHFFEKLKLRRVNELVGFVPSPLPTVISEKKFRACSFGLMQIMGETARVIGYQGQYLTALVDVDTNLEWGCRFLSRLFDRGRAKNLTGDELLFYVLTKWNGSRDYPPLVIDNLTSGTYKNVYFDTPDPASS